MKAFKTSRKEYIEKYAERQQLSYNLNRAFENNQPELVAVLKEEIEYLNESYFNKLTKVPVSYYIGYRSYYEEVVKIGACYFQYGKAMTKGRGYRSLEEIPEITDSMKESMLSDTYYY